ncbi:hypothetical protein NKG05_24810 [Oerskovia sp. M15]
MFSDSEVRNGIYLPEGRWVDYWTGDVLDGGRVLNGYSARSTLSRCSSGPGP